MQQGGTPTGCCGGNGTSVRVGGELKAGIAWYGVSPKINGAGKVEGQVKKQGYLALADNNLTMPAIAMAPNGKGAIAFTVLGEDPLPECGLRDRLRRFGRPDPHRWRRAWARRRLHELQGVRRRPAEDALGRLRRGGHGREHDLDRVGVHRPDVHARAIPHGRHRLVRRRGPSGRISIGTCELVDARVQAEPVGDVTSHDGTGSPVPSWPTSVRRSALPSKVMRALAATAAAVLIAGLSMSAASGSSGSGVYGKVSRGPILPVCVQRTSLRGACLGHARVHSRRQACRRGAEQPNRRLSDLARLGRLFRAAGLSARPLASVAADGAHPGGTLRASELPARHRDPLRRHESATAPRGRTRRAALRRPFCCAGIGRLSRSGSQDGRLPPSSSTVSLIQSSACAVSTRYEYELLVQLPPFPNELTASTTFVPATRSGPPESPEQTPPLLTCSLMNSSLMRSLLAISVLGREEPRERVGGCFLAGSAAGPAAVEEVLDTEPDDVDRRVVPECVDLILARERSVLAHGGAGPERPATVRAGSPGRHGAAGLGEDHDGDVVRVEAGNAAAGRQSEPRIPSSSSPSAR